MKCSDCGREMTELHHTVPPTWVYFYQCVCGSAVVQPFAYAEKIKMDIRIEPASRDEEWWEGFDWGVTSQARHEHWCAFLLTPGSPEVSICDCGVYGAAMEKHLRCKPSATKREE